MPVSRSRNQAWRTSPLDNENGLIAWWPFDDGSGFDSSGFGNQGALQNAPTAAGGLIGGNGIIFNGSTQYVRVTTKPSLDGFAEFSLSAWVYLTADTDTNLTCIAVKPVTDGGTPTNPFEVWGVWIEHTTRKMTFALSKGTSGSRVLLTTTGALTLSRSTHIACTWDGSTMRAYFNGAADATTASFTGPVGANSIDARLGGFVSQSVNGYWTGTLDDIRLYKRNLTPCEVNALYNQGLAFALAPDEWEMPAPPMVAYYQLERGMRGISRGMRAGGFR